MSDATSRNSADVLDAQAALLYARWIRAVDLLWREAVRRRNLNLAGKERARAARRIKNLRKIVRKALSDYHQIELERQRQAQAPGAPGEGASH